MHMQHCCGALVSVYCSWEGYNSLLKPCVRYGFLWCRQEPCTHLPRGWFQLWWPCSGVLALQFSSWPLLASAFELCCGKQSAVLSAIVPTCSPADCAKQLHSPAACMQSYLHMLKHSSFDRHVRCSGFFVAHTAYTLCPKSWQQATCAISGWSCLIMVIGVCAGCMAFSILWFMILERPPITLAPSEPHCAQTTSVGIVQPTPSCFLLHRTLGPDGFRHQSRSVADCSRPKALLSYRRRKETFSILCVFRTWNCTFSCGSDNFEMRHLRVVIGTKRGCSSAPVVLRSTCISSEFSGLDSWALVLHICCGLPSAQRQWSVDCLRY